MTTRSREDFKQLAARARKAFYAGESAEQIRRASRARSTTPDNGTINPGQSARPGDASRGQPCPGTNPWWKGLPKKARSLVAVVASADVPDEIREMRHGKCGKCPYAREVRDKLYCGCCGCPIVQMGKLRSDLGYKNGKAGWDCPGPDPAFGPVEVMTPRPV